MSANYYKTDQSLFTGAIESANIFNGAVAEVSYSSGLLDSLSEFSSIDDIIKKMGFVQDKKHQLANLLDILNHQGYLEKNIAGSTTAYRTNDNTVNNKRSLDGSLQRYQHDAAWLSPWYRDGHADTIRNSNKQFLGSGLEYLRSPSASIRFGGEYINDWKINLSNPLYEYGRLVAVQLMTERGTRFLDLACGLGYGAQRLAEYSKHGCTVIGVDKSPDMLAVARQIIYPNANVKFILQDLNEGLPDGIPNNMDGVLFNGAFHFIDDKIEMLKAIHAVLRPGGILVIGHCFCESGFEDEAMHRFYFSMLENPLHLISFAKLRTLVADSGFSVFKEYHRGSHSYIIAEKEYH